VKYKLVYIEWEDAKGLDGGWRPLEEAVYEASSRALVHQVGFILDEGKDYLTLMAAILPDTNQVGGVWRIPKAWILKRKTIKL
jgi:hypothetical protein